jgi:uncharacterized damage-inducible protein DinB
MNKEVERIQNQLERALSGKAWHGPALLELLSGVEAKTAEAHPIAGAHSIREILAHIVAWQEEAARRVEGRGRGELPPVEDWPEGASFDATVERLKTSHRALLDAVSRLSDERLGETVKGRSESYYVLLHGIIQHNLYHAGQIALLKRALSR